MRVEVEGVQKMSANLARQDLTTPRLARVARRTSSPHGRTLYTNKMGLVTQEEGNEKKANFSFHQ